MSHWKMFFHEVSHLDYSFFGHVCHLCSHCFVMSSCCILFTLLGARQTNIWILTLGAYNQMEVDTEGRPRTDVCPVYMETQGWGGSIPFRKMIGRYFLNEKIIERWFVSCQMEKRWRESFRQGIRMSTLRCRNSWMCSGGNVEYKCLCW